MSSVLFAWCCIIIFSLGFMFFEILSARLLPRKKTYRHEINNKNFRVSVIFYVLLIFFITFTLYKTFFVNSASEIYKIRSGEQQGNLLDFFVLNLLSAIKFCIFITLFKFKDKKYILFFSIFVTLSLLLQSTGRFNLMLHIVFIIIIIFNMSPIKISMAIIGVFFVSIPLVLSLKTIIYIISTGDSMIDFSLSSSFDIDLYLNNFGHPLISLMQVDGLIDKIGYRYFYDIFQGFYFYFKLIGVNSGLSITYFNSENLIGIRSSIIPPGYLAFGFVQLSYLGVFISGCIYRYIGYVGEYVYNNSLINGVECRPNMFFIAFLCANTFYHGDFRIFVMSIFFPFFFFIILNRYLGRYE